MGSTAPPPPPSPTRSLEAITIRAATPADAPAIRALGAAVFTTTFRASGCTAAQLQSYLDEAYTPAAILATLTAPATHHTLVATTPSAPSTILGFALLNRASSEPAVERFPGPRCELQRLYVSGEAQGRGVGKALMREAETWARDGDGGWGVRTMWLGVWEGNGPAQGLYGGLGFGRVGEHVFDVGGDEQTDWILVKAL